MRYHILMCDSIDSNKLLVRNVSRELKKTLLKFLEKQTGINASKFLSHKFKARSKIALEDLHDYPLPYHWFDKEQMIELVSKLKSEDCLVIHGEGNPFIIGLEEPSIYDLTPLGFVKMMVDYGFPREIPFNVEFLSCNMGSSWHGINYAFFSSLALTKLYNYSNVIFRGPSSYVIEKSQGGFSASTDIESKHGTHLRIEDAFNHFHQGIQIRSALKSANLETLELSWATKYIKKIDREIERLVCLVFKSYLDDWLHPENKEDANLYLTRLAALNPHYLLREVLPEVMAMFRTPASLVRWFSAADNSMKRILEELQESTRILELKTSSRSDLSLWSRRVESREAQLEFDKIYGLTKLS